MGQYLYSLAPTAKKVAGVGSVVTVVDAAIRLPPSSLLAVAGVLLLGLAMILRCEFVMQRERHRHQLAMARLKRDGERRRQQPASHLQVRPAKN